MKNIQKPESLHWRNIGEILCHQITPLDGVVGVLYGRTRAFIIREISPINLAGSGKEMLHWHASIQLSVGKLCKEYLQIFTFCYST